MGEIAISRNKPFLNKVVLVDGLPGCGKTLLSAVISALDRVELLSYSYEIELYCQLCSLNKLPEKSVEYLIKMQLDLKLYDTMMSRNVNFRPSDLSSVIGNHDPSRYFSRLFEPGDEVIPEKIEIEKPILNIAVHHLLASSKPVWRALGNSCVLVEVLRHPLYMIRQLSVHERDVAGSPRYFHVHVLYDGVEIPYYTKGWEEAYLGYNPVERAIHIIDRLSEEARVAREILREECGAKIITVPFESFVLAPGTWIQTIAEALDTRVTDSTRRVMSEQKVPRQMIAGGLDREIYRRYGWKPPSEGASERDELNVRLEDVRQDVGSEALHILDRLCEEYEQTYWNPDQ